jgi:ComF family protein
LGEILVAAYRRYQLKAEVIVPVPLHETKLKERGYNQSELLARQLGQALNLPVNLTTLRRTRQTKSQMTLGAGERSKNVIDAFSCMDKKLDRQNILLVDDVCTTGSTLDACAAALKAGGATSVWGLTLAKAH